jgi:hypothetical protein
MSLRSRFVSKNSSERSTSACVRPLPSISKARLWTNPFSLSGGIPRISSTAFQRGMNSSLIIQSVLLLVRGRRMNSPCNDGSSRSSSLA